MSDSPMDLILSHDRHGNPRVRLPNPLHPHDAPPVIRNHCLDVRRVRAWGYAGAGPSDVALNVLQAFLPGDDGSFASDGTRISRAAEGLYPAFKIEILAQIPEDGAVVSAESIRAWIQARLEAGA